MTNFITPFREIDKSANLNLKHIKNNVNAVTFTTLLGKTLKTRRWKVLKNILTVESPMLYCDLINEKDGVDYVTQKL